MSTSNFLSAKNVSTIQWENENSGTAYPFEDDTLPAGFPTDLVVDACICIPTSIPLRPALSCVHTGPSFVSATVTLDGKVALFVSVAKSKFVPFSPVLMESSMYGVSGMITFGNVMFDRIMTERGNYVFSESAVVRPIIGRLYRFKDSETNETAKGYVGFELQDGVSVSLREANNVSLLSFSTSDDIRKEVLTPCAKSDITNRSPEPIRSINGVKPDKDGRIAIVFRKM